MCPVVFFHALRGEIRSDGGLSNKAVYLVLDIQADGQRDNTAYPKPTVQTCIVIGSATAWITPAGKTENSLPRHCAPFMPPPANKRRKWLYTPLPKSSGVSSIRPSFRPGNELGIRDSVLCIPA